jgi:hypothetical protein
MIGRAAALGALTLIIGMRSAHAAPLEPLVRRLRVEPNECFDAASLAGAMAQSFGRDVLPANVEIEITGKPRDPDGLILRVLRDGRLVGERRFPSMTAPCAEVRDAVGLAGALAIDALLAEPEPVSAETPPSAAPSATPTLEAPAPTPEVVPRLVRFAASLDGVALFGVLPAPVPAVAPGLGVRIGPIFEARLSGLFSGTGSTGLDTGAVAVALFAARADGCAGIERGIVRARGCAGVAAGGLHVTTQGLMPALSPAVPWAAADLGLGVRFAVAPWFGLVLGADLLVPLTRPRFEVVTPTGAGFASQGLPSIGAALRLGPEFWFP